MIARERLLHRAIDSLAALFMGTGTVSLVCLMVSNHWNMFFAMLFGMGTGLVVLIIVMLPFIPFSSFFELFTPGMIITMFLGMTTGMVEAKFDLDFSIMILVAVLFSGLIWLWIDRLNTKLSGEVPLGH